MHCHMSLPYRPIAPDTQVSRRDTGGTPGYQFPAALENAVAGHTLLDGDRPGTVDVWQSHHSRQAKAREIPVRLEDCTGRPGPDATRPEEGPCSSTTK